MTTGTARYEAPSTKKDTTKILRNALIHQAYQQAIQQDQKTTPKSDYNAALGHFKDHGKLAMKGNIVMPYTFIDQTLADTVQILVDGARRLDYRHRDVAQDIKVIARDGSYGLDIRLQNNALQRGLIFVAEPSLDGDVLRYESHMQLFFTDNDQELQFENVTLEPNSKAALRSLAPRNAKEWYNFVTGLKTPDQR